MARKKAGLPSVRRPESPATRSVLILDFVGRRGGSVKHLRVFWSFHPRLPEHAFPGTCSALAQVLWSCTFGFVVVRVSRSSFFARIVQSRRLVFSPKVFSSHLRLCSDHASFMASRSLTGVPRLHRGFQNNASEKHERKGDQSTSSLEIVDLGRQAEKPIPLQARLPSLG